MFHYHNSAIFYSFLTDYKYLCCIRATAKWHKKETWYEVICATAEYQRVVFSEDVWLNVGIQFVPIKAEFA